MSSSSVITLAVVAGQQARVARDALFHVGAEETVAIGRRLTRWCEGGAFDLSTREVGITLACLAVVMEDAARRQDIHTWWEARTVYADLGGLAATAN